MAPRGRCIMLSGELDTQNLMPGKLLEIQNFYLEERSGVWDWSNKKYNLTTLITVAYRESCVCGVYKQKHTRIHSHFLRLKDGSCSSYGYRSLSLSLSLSFSNPPMLLPTQPSLESPLLFLFLDLSSPHIIPYPFWKLPMRSSRINFRTLK